MKTKNMVTKIRRNQCIYLVLLVFSLGAMISCHPNDSIDGNGPADPNVDASFTITLIEGVTNRYLLESQGDNVIASKWDIGTGSYSGSTKEEIFLPDAGTYNIMHTVIGRGGETNTSNLELIVPQSDPIAGNIIEGGKLENATDHAKWTALSISASGAELVFNEGSATIFSTQEWAQQGIYQAIEVVKDKEYTIDMLVSGGAGFSNTWFEVYAGTIPPVQGQEYSDNKIMGLSTWDGCATEAFSGSLSTIGCVKNANTDSVNNTVTFTESGTIYLVIRSGGQSYDPAGITVTNIEMRGKS